MYAVIESGSKQYKVEEGDVIDVELLNDEKKTEFKNVLCVNNGKTTHVGKPFLKDFVVKGDILEVVRASKVISFRFKRRQNQRVKQGHRQNYTRVKITKISEAAAKKASKPTKAKEE